MNKLLNSDGPMQLALALQKKFNSLYDIIAMMPGHVYWLDKDNVYQGCNSLQANAANLKSRETIVGKRNRDMIWKDFADALDDVNSEVMHNGKTLIIEETAVMSHGKGIYLSQKAPLRNDNNEVIGIIGISFDITKRKREEQQLRDAIEKSEINNFINADYSIYNSSSGTSRLTPKEIESLYWARYGKSAEETAIILRRSTETIKSHLKSIRKKMNCRTIAQAIAEAINCNYFN